MPQISVPLGSLRHTTLVKLQFSVPLGKLEHTIMTTETNELIGIIRMNVQCMTNAAHGGYRLQPTTFGILA